MGGSIFSDKPITANPIALSMETLLSLDTRLTLLFNGSDCVWLDRVAMLATHIYVWIPFLAVIVAFLAVRSERRNLWLILLGVAVCVLISDQVASSIFKPWVCRLRPTHDPALAGAVDIVNGYRGGQYGFFSSHAANTMSVAVYLSLIFRQRLVTASLLLWSVFTCWTRVYLGVHFFGDVLVGVIFGACVGACLFVLLRRYVNPTTLSFNPADSYYVSCSFAVSLLAVCILAL